MFRLIHKIVAAAIPYIHIIVDGYFSVSVATCSIFTMLTIDVRD
jgi:hypothetical protein